MDVMIDRALVRISGGLAELPLIAPDTRGNGRKGVARDISGGPIGFAKAIADFINAE